MESYTLEFFFFSFSALKKKKKNSNKQRTTDTLSSRFSQEEKDNSFIRRKKMSIDEKTNSMSEHLNSGEYLNEREIFKLGFRTPKRITHTQEQKLCIYQRTK